MMDWLLEILACPRHRTALSAAGDGGLTCSNGCHFPIVDEVPVILLEEAQQTMDLAHVSMRKAREATTDGRLYVESLGLSDAEKRGILDLASGQPQAIDPVVSFLVSATNGIVIQESDRPPERLPNSHVANTTDSGESVSRYRMQLGSLVCGGCPERLQGRGD